MAAAEPRTFGSAPDGTAFARSGRRGGRPVVLIHGLGLCRDFWRPVLAPLEERYHVVAYDLYGHGGSAPLPGEASLGLFARQLAGLMDHCGIEAADLVGFSIGGMVNRRFAMDLPDRCRSLAVLNSPHDRGAEAQRLVEERARRAGGDGRMATMPEALERWFTPSFRERSPEVLDLVSGWRAATDGASYAGAAWVLARGVAELSGPPPAIDRPALVLTCEDDAGSTPAMSRAIAAGIPGSETVVVPGLRHLGLMEEPGLFLEPLLAFLERS